MTAFMTGPLLNVSAPSFPCVRSFATDSTGSAVETLAQSSSFEVVK